MGGGCPPSPFADAASGRPCLRRGGLVMPSRQKVKGLGCGVAAAFAITPITKVYGK